MTVCASPGPSAAHEQQGPPPPPAADEDGGAARAGCAITVDGAYAARLTRSGDSDSWYPERWTLDGPEPYAVPLPGNQPEEPGTEVQPMGDGRVLIRRLVDGRHTFSLLYPTGPGTGELLLGAVESPEGTVLRLLPPAPGGERAYALAAGSRSSAVWLVAGGSFGPELLAEVPGHCSGGVWLDRTGRMLALDRRAGGRTKTVVVDLGDGGAVSPLLQITPGSDDRLLLADPDSGLLLIGSDAPSPGRERLGWGVLGSTLPVRFPECLRLSPDCTMTPFAIQPGQVLTPEHCAVALHCRGPFGSWIGVWRPTERGVRHLPAPEGWLAGTGLWTEDGVLRLLYATAAVPCGVARWTAPAAVREQATAEGQVAVREQATVQEQVAVREQAAARGLSARGVAHLPGPRGAQGTGRQDAAHRPGLSGSQAGRPAAPKATGRAAQKAAQAPQAPAGQTPAPPSPTSPQTPQAPQAPPSPAAQAPQHTPQTPPAAPPRVPLPFSLPLPSSTDEAPHAPHAQAPVTEPPASAAARPVPLQQAALTGRMATG